MRLSATDNLPTSTDTVSPVPWYAAPIAALTSIYQAKKLTDLNIKRAEQGLPALSASDTAPQMNFGLAPDQLNKILMFGGLALGAIVLLALRRRK